MKSTLILITLLTLSGLFLFNQDQSSQQPSEIEIMKSFQAWKSKRGMNFNDSEEQYRFAQYKLNYLFVENHNQNSESLTLQLNQFAAMSNEEFKQTILLAPKQETQNLLPEVEYTTYQEADEPLPSSVNWASKGKVMATQNQGSCGSCWAFSAVASLQSLNAIATDRPYMLSVQQILSCTPKETLDNKTEGCGGGLPRYAFAYTSQAGIEMANEYPYANAAGGPAKPCEYNADKIVFKNKGLGIIKPGDVKGIQQNLVRQPLSIGIDAGSVFFQFYKSGIIEPDQCGTAINHSIALVGYNTESDAPYWIVQNSWGTDWGQDGFGEMAMVSGKGTCAINQQVDYPTSVDQGPNISSN